MHEILILNRTAAHVHGFGSIIISVFLGRPCKVLNIPSMYVLLGTYAGRYGDGPLRPIYHGPNRGYWYQTGTSSGFNGRLGILTNFDKQQY